MSLDTLQIPDSLSSLATLLNDVSDPADLEARLSELSRDQWRDLLDLSRKARATEDTLEGDVAFIEYVWAEHLQENNEGFLPQHLRDGIDYIRGLVAKKQNGGVLAPRGSSKSTGITQGWLSKKIAANPHIRVGLFSNTDRQAWAFSGAIMATFEGNDRFIELYGDCRSTKKWTAAEWLHRDSKHHRSKDRTVYAGGVGAPITSKRFDIVLLDDILDKENTANADQMQKTLDWFNLVLKPCLVPGGIIIYIGTRWAEGDLAEHLMLPVEKGGKGWPFYVVSAFLRDDDGEIKLDDGGSPISYWEDRWPIPVLMKEREEMGSPDFAVAYLNDLSLRMTGNVFPRLPSQYYFTELPEGVYTYKMGIDLASSEKESADYTARVVTAVDDNGHFWVLHAYRDKRETGHAEFVADGFAAFPDVALVIVENNQFQSTLIQHVMRDFAGIPIEGRKSDTDKVTRARAVAAKYEAHRVHHHVSLKGSEFERELLAFPKGHDDYVDALGFSMDLTGGGFFFGKLGSRGSALRR